MVPLPQNSDDTVEAVCQTVNCEGLIVYRGNRYTVPWRGIGQVLPIWTAENELIVHVPHLHEIAQHRLYPTFASGQTSRREEDRPEEEQRFRNSA